MKKKVKVKVKVEKLGGVPVEECNYYVRGIVNSVSAHYRPTSSMMEKEDMVQDGFLALVKHCRKFDKTRKVKLFTFLYNHVRSEIMAGIKRSHFVHIPQHLFAKRASLNLKYRNHEKFWDKEKNQLNYDLLLAEGLIHNSDWKRLVWLRDHQYSSSYDDTAQIRDNGNYLDEFIDIDNDLKESLFKYLMDTPRITDRNKRIFVGYFGLVSSPLPMNLISSIFNLTPDAIVKILRSVKVILAEPLGWVEDEFGTAVALRLRNKFSYN